jgi:Leucine-rich repeat (LRR) protein
MKTKLLLMLLLLMTINTFSQVNLVSNGGFETWTNSTTLSDWTTKNTVIQNTTYFTEGSKSAQLSIANNTTKPEILAQVPMVAGKTYTIKFKYKYVTSNYNGQHPISLNISKNGSATTLSSSTFATNNSWTVKETTFTPDQNLSYDLSISLATFDAAAFNVIIDDVQVYIQGTEQYTLIPDANFETALISLGIDYGLVDGKVLTNSINKLTSLVIYSKSITDLTGIQDFAALTTLNCNFNEITTLDLSKNTLLTSLTCRINKLNSLDLSKNILLTSLDLYSNNLTLLDVSANKALTYLDCSSNKITTLDVSNNLNLATLDCNRNTLKVLDVSKNTALSSLNCTMTALNNLDISKNLALTKLDCSNNSLTVLDLSKNTNITFLECGNNLLDVLDLTSNTALQYLMCENNGGYGNKISTLNLSKNNNLIEIDISGVSLTNLDISKNIALKQLDCRSTKIVALDLSTNTVLETLLCSENKLTTLDISKNKFLKNLDCSYNQLTSLDVSTNNSLILLNCFSNNLTSLNLKNGNNSNFLKNNGIYFKDFNNASGGDSYTNFKNNVNLNCIQVDDVTYSNTNWSGIKDETTYFSPINCASVINVTDPKFEDKLIALGIDTDGKNGIVALSSINTLTSLDVSNSFITNLTGIQGFTALKTLNISGNLLKKVDLSKNAVLTTLNASNNATLTCIQVADIAVATNWSTTKDDTASFSLDCEVYTLIPDSKFEEKLIALKIDRDGLNGKVKTESISEITNLDISVSSISDLTGIQDFTSLKQLYVSNNMLTTADFSKNILLTTLSIYSNKLTTIEVSKNIALTSLDCGRNNVSNIDVTKNINLNYLDLSNNKLNTIDITKNTKLIRFVAYENALVSLDISNNTELQDIYCYNNQIRTLDLSKLTKLKSINATNNKLVNVNIKNGANALLTPAPGYYGGVYLTENPDLKCIQVDDATYSNTNWITKKDATATYSSDTCPVVVPYTLIPDSNFEDKLIALGIDKDGKNGKVATMSIAVLTSLNVSNSSITDLTGIADFTSLTSLDCSNNVLKTINVSKNIALKNLNVSKNQLTDFYFYENTLLSDLNCSGNAITYLNVSSNNLLSNLNCSTNAISVLDVSKNTKLSILSASFNKIQNLDVSKNTVLKELDCASNNMYNLNLKNGNNVNMQRMIFGNLTQNPNLLCIQVDDVDFSNKNWIAKDATATYSSEACLENLQYTLIPDPNFEDVLIANGIDKDGKNGKVLTANIKYLTYLYAYNSTNKITDLTGIEDFASLASLYCYNGAISKLDVSKNLNLKLLDLSNNKVTVLDVSKNTLLESLNATSNTLTELNVSNNLSLKELIVPNNQLSTIDLSKNTGLTKLDIGSNLIGSLDLSVNTALTSLGAYGTKIVNLDISKNVNLTSLDVRSNALMTSIDITKNTAITYLNVSSCEITNIDVSSNTALASLDVSKNKLTSLDLSKNTFLTSIVAASNQLTSLNLKNGKNTLLVSNKVSFTSNPKLYCILVDDVTYANTNWTYKKDGIATYNTECTGELTLPSNNFAIETKGESCLGENNGEINITAKQIFSYVASVNGIAKTFTDNSLKLSALTPGTYTILITIPGQIFEQTFNIVIAKGATITGKSSITDKKINVEITEGTAPYTVFVNGIEQFETNTSSFSVTAKGGGLLEVKTAKACEGIYAKDIAGLDMVLSAYPNPTSGSFEIELPTSNKEVSIEINTLDGRVISNKIYTLENGTAKLTLENQPKGVYIAKIYLDTIKNVKIIKN